MRLQKDNSADRAKRPFDLLLPVAAAVKSGSAAAMKLSAAAALIFLVYTGELRAQGYVPGFEDLPLMFELDADDEPMIFDAPGGRIVEARAVGTSTPLRVMSFYRETLAQLGWRAVSTGTFERDGEQLRMTIAEPQSGQVEVRFSLSPRSKF
jgi:hypothetical protein